MIVVIERVLYNVELVGQPATLRVLNVCCNYLKVEFSPPTLQGRYN